MITQMDVRTRTRGRPAGGSGDPPHRVRAALSVVWKWGPDLALAALLILLTAPLLLGAMLLVKLTSRGPVFYSQVRLGRHGTRFRIYKLRTMTHDCEKLSGPRWATVDDPRITPVGRVLRHLHIDELPQLVNVLRGDMALVGPRPERPMIAQDLEDAIPGYADRLAVKPGLSGLAQVQFPADTDLGSVCRKLVADLSYVRAVCPLLDLRILFATALYLLHTPFSWRRRVLGRYAEPRPAADRGRSLGDRLARIYDIPRMSDRIGTVQGLRGAAASMVFLVHFLALFGVYLGPPAAGPAVQAVETVAHFGTDIFLLISGFLIYGMLIRRPLGYGTFLRARLRRIYPPFLCVFGLYLALSAAIPRESKIPPGAADAAVYLLQNVALLPVLIGAAPMITVTWTLGYEVLLYASVPLVVGVTGMRTWAAGRRAAFWGVAWVAYMIYCGVVSPTHVRLGVYLCAFLAYEVLGASPTAVTAKGGARAAIAVVAGLAALVLLRCGGVTVPTSRTLPGLGALLSAAATAVCVLGIAGSCFGGGIADRLLTWRPLLWLGNCSYSFYLLHGLSLKALLLFATSVIPPHLDGRVVFWVLLPVGFAGSVVASTLLFLAVEKRLSFSRQPRGGGGVPAAPGSPAFAAGPSVDFGWQSDTLHDDLAAQRTFANERQIVA
ncbi:MAG: hypothetical protein JWO38_5819 [Gemmataceae bacterium]|nr:hypothetical protein [Gemmataceae bacterium]